MTASTTPPAHKPARVKPTRIQAIDIFRGLSILEVVSHHVLGFSIRYAVQGSDLHAWLIFLNRSLHFAVPAFLFMTAVVFTQAAVLKPFNVKRFYWGRFKKSLMPYVIWTLLYGTYKIAVFGGDFLDWEKWLFWLQYGKGYYHLYFLLIALQFYVLFPLFVPLWKRKQRHFWRVVVISFALQLGMYFLNKETSIVDFRYPATMVWWYMPALALGMYFGSRYKEFEWAWRNYRLYIFIAAAMGYAFYVPLAFDAMIKLPVNNYQYNIAYWVFTTSFALMLFGLAHSFARGPQWFKGPLSFLGKHSLQIYLIHPALLDGFKALGYPASPFLFVLTMLAYIVIALLVPLGIAYGIRNTKLSLWLFGR
ncbi:acyltransferase [Deinococcus misasensis]|uniref:acyltransferase n=1 Tax=Deinococcus misasensis TaxID=392413 RepID=UPI000550EF2B|nr:acyltransferase [Deinococcus misasensis]